MILDVIGD